MSIGWFESTILNLGSLEVGPVLFIGWTPLWEFQRIGRNRVIVSSTGSSWLLITGRWPGSGARVGRPGSCTWIRGPGSGAGRIGRLPFRQDQGIGRSGITISTAGSSRLSIAGRWRWVGRSGSCWRISWPGSGARVSWFLIARSSIASIGRCRIVVSSSCRWIPLGSGDWCDRGVG